MKITDVRTTVLRVPDLPGIQDSTIRKPERAAGGCSCTSRPMRVTRASASPRAPGTRDVIHARLKPLLIGQDPLDHERLWEDMFWRVRGFGRKGVAFCAISAVDIAPVGPEGQDFGVPLYQLARAVHRHRADLRLRRLDLASTRTSWSREQTGYVERGIPRVKMKVAKDFGQVRGRGPAAAGGRAQGGRRRRRDLRRRQQWLLRQAGHRACARAWPSTTSRWFEEPVLADDIAGLAEIARAIDIPVATGEHEYTKYGFKDLIAQGGADIVQPDVGRVGGVTEWLKVAHLAHAFNLPVAPHAVQLVHLHLACCTPNLKVVEVAGRPEETDRLFYTEFPEPRDGMWSPYPDRPAWAWSSIRTPWSATPSKASVLDLLNQGLKASLSLLNPRGPRGAQPP